MTEPKSKNRPSADVVRLPIELDRVVFDLLEKFCAKAGRTRKAVVSHAILEHVELPVRPFPELLEEIALKKKLGRKSLESDPAKTSRRPKPNRKEKRE